MFTKYYVLVLLLCISVVTSTRVRRVGHVARTEKFDLAHSIVAEEL
jgi:hypothetical protein